VAAASSRAAAKAKAYARAAAEADAAAALAFYPLSDAALADCLHAALAPALTSRNNTTDDSRAAALLPGFFAVGSGAGGSGVVGSAGASARREGLAKK
jgi:hypothetical protein